MNLALEPAVALLAKLRARDISSRELTELYLERIDQLNPQLNAVVTLDAERALARADGLDKRSEPAGPPAGCGVVGHKSSWGIAPYRGTLPAPPVTHSRTDVAAPGPIARSADDLELALGVLAAPDEWDATAWRLELPPPRHERISDH